MGANHQTTVNGADRGNGETSLRDATISAKPYVLRTEYKLDEIALEGSFNPIKFRGVCAGCFDPIGAARLAALNVVEPQKIIAEPMLMFANSRLLKHDPYSAVRHRALHLAMHTYNELPAEDPRRAEVLGDIVSRVFDSQRNVQDTALRFFEKQPSALAEPFRIRGNDGIHISGDAAILALSKGLAEGKLGAVSHTGTRVDIVAILVSSLKNGELPEKARYQVELDLRRLLNPDSDYREKDERTRAVLLSGMTPLLDKPNILAYFARSLGAGSVTQDILILDQLYLFLSKNGNLERYVPIEERVELAHLLDTSAKKYRSNESRNADEAVVDSAGMITKCDQIRALLPNA